MIEKLFAAAVLLACLGALARMALKPRQQQRLDAALQRAWQRVRGVFRRRREPPARPLTQQDAAKAAEEAIRRAREGQWEGNVFRPRSFRRPKK
ncbi:MAG: hypothetical protein AB1430_16690 [Pseudomonadota bacterium]